MLKKEARIILVITRALLLIGLFALIYVPTLMGASCENLIKMTYDSPKVDYKVIVFKKDCNPPKSYYIHISVIKKPDILKEEEGNLFILHLRDNDEKQIGQPYLPIDIFNFEKDSFIIRYPKEAKVIKQKFTINKIRVKYKLR
jgi:hypothetical protein